jgi:hypothetical protein
MQRHRQVAAAPERPASETWDVIAKLVVDTLERSPKIEAKDVASVMQAAAPAGRMLIAGGHLDRCPMVVVAEPVHVSITTVSGTDATTLEENLEAVPGGATAVDWMIYLPTPDPLGKTVRSIAVACAHLSADDPPLESEPTKSSVSANLVDLDAFAKRVSSDD